MIYKLHLSSTNNYNGMKCCFLELSLGQMLHMHELSYIICANYIVALCLVIGNCNNIFTINVLKITITYKNITLYMFVSRNTYHCMYK